MRLGGADVTLDYSYVDVVVEVKRMTGGGTDVSIEALGTQQTFESVYAVCSHAERCPVSVSTQESWQFL